MRTKNWILFAIISAFALLIAQLVLDGVTLRKVARCCNCDENKALPEIYVGHPVSVYDSLTHKTGTKVFVDRVSLGEKGDTTVTTFYLMTIWNECSEKVVEKSSAFVKKVISKMKKATKPAQNGIAKKEVASKEPTVVKEDKFIQANINISPATKNFADNLKIELWSTTPKKKSLLYSSNLLPSSYSVSTNDWSNNISGVAIGGDLGNVVEYNYNVVPDLHVKEYIEKAKRHLWVGTALASVGTIAYASTWFNEIPTFVKYNGLDAFDPANKYYDHNFHERERLKTLKWVRGGAIVVGAIGGFEIVHGILLLKNADISVAPEEITLKYNF